jgi:AbrB family looped-hinge helix DNA binding protein
VARNISTVTRKGQVTIPIEIRRRLGISEGDQVEFVEENGKIGIAPRRSEQLTHLPQPIEDLPANSVVRRVAEVAAKYRRSRPITLEEIEEAVAYGWTERERRFQEQRRKENAG